MKSPNYRTSSTEWGIVVRFPGKMWDVTACKFRQTPLSSIGFWSSIGVFIPRCPFWQSSSASLRLFPRIFPRPWDLLHTALHQGLQERFEGWRHTEARHGTSGGSESQVDSGDSMGFHMISPTKIKNSPVSGFLKHNPTTIFCVLTI